MVDGYDYGDEGGFANEAGGVYSPSFPRKLSDVAGFIFGSYMPAGAANAKLISRN